MEINGINGVNPDYHLINKQKSKTANHNPCINDFDVQTQKQKVDAKTALASYMLPKINVAFKGIGNDNKIQISDLKNQIAKEFFEELSANSPEKCNTLLNNKEFFDYCNSGCGIFCDQFAIINTKNVDIFKNAVENIDVEDIGYVIDSLSKRNGKVDGKEIINGILLLSNDKKAFDYALNSHAFKEDTYYTSGYTKDLCRYLLSNCKTEVLQSVNYNTVLEIEKGLNNDFQQTISEYKSNSDAFSSKPEEVKKLHDYLKNCVNENDVTVYRGEKSAWMFDTVTIDTKTEIKTKLLVFLNPKSRKDLVFPNNKHYSDFAKQNVYDHIMSKDKLTLADAMLAVKYSDSKSFINGVLDKINNATIKDSGFKSYTLSEDFALRWANHKNTTGGGNTNDMLSLVTKTNIKKGNEVRYCYDTSQYEFIVNNNPKTMTFSNAKYDKETNTFYIDSELIAT